MTLTRTGLRLVGLEFEVWSPAWIGWTTTTPPRSCACRRRSPVRAAGCVSGRWRRRGKASWHLADAALPAPVPTGWAQQGISEAWELIEVELTQKARPRVVAVLKTRPRTPPLSTYYVPAAPGRPGRTARRGGAGAGRPPGHGQALWVAGTSYGGAQ